LISQVTISMKRTDLKKQIAATLKNQLPNISAQDKEDAATENVVHVNTINNYLKGDIGNVDFGLKLIEFFTERISKKFERLNQVQA
jgi:hypothetical protein